MLGGYKMAAFNTIEEALEDLRRGKIILVTDDEDRENEGDFICAAQFATTENINFMATHGKGLICMPMSEEYVEKLKTMIDPDLYPSSYPKKAQVPTYFGFLECKITSGNNITERRITNSGKKMYEAIISDDIATRQELLMDAVENVIFGKNNGGSPSSESDIDAPDLAIRCILDTGYCTSHEYAYMIWNLHDNGKKYYKDNIFINDNDFHLHLLLIMLYSICGLNYRGK